MGVFEDFSLNVDLLANKVAGLHNRIDELTESSVSAHKRITQLEQKLREEITSIRNQLQSWSDARDEREVSILNELWALRDRVQKISNRLNTPYATATVTCSDQPKVGSTFGPLFDAPSSDPEGIMQRQHEESQKHDDSIARSLQQNCQLKRSPVPGTWAWACEQMLAGKTVRRGKSGWAMSVHGGFIREAFNGMDQFRLAEVSRVELESTDWQVVE